MQKILLFTFSLLLLAACDDDNSKEDLTENVNHEGAVETVLNIEHLDNQLDVLITTHKIWVKGNLFKTIEKRDTVPSLGDFSETNDKGETVTGKKDYELYITVK
jgi:hypothetical protein